jgi:hypothetical protein
MKKAARDMDFMTAAWLWDEMFKMQKELEGMNGMFKLLNSEKQTA